MAVTTGRNGSLRLEIGGAIDTTPSALPTVALGNLRTWSIDASANLLTVDTASMGNFTSWNQTYTMSRAWSASFAGLWDHTEVQVDMIQPGMIAKFKLFPDNGTQTVFYEGTGVISSVTVNASYDGMVELSFSLQGNGALTVDLAG